MNIKNNPPFKKSKMTGDKTEKEKGDKTEEAIKTDNSLRYLLVGEKSNVETRQGTTNEKRIKNRKLFYFF